ncbi:MAG: hypothetical protein QGD88_12135, partial [Anaerolineae bacterium]|nr:hypothetical protein [Anaerolineae bacterium]
WNPGNLTLLKNNILPLTKNTVASRSTVSSSLTGSSLLATNGGPTPSRGERPTGGRCTRWYYEERSLRRGNLR